MKHLWTLSLLCSMAAAQTPSRLKELVSVEGIRDNQLLGYGLVVGLAGTGDKRQTFFPTQTLANMLERFGIQTPQQSLQVRNIAAVLVTATLPPFSQPGQRIDVTVSSLGDSTNLAGGQLISTTLKAADGSVFALAQGPVVTGGFVAGRSGSNSQTVNHPTAGRVPNGAIVERPAPSVAPGATIRLQLKQPDFTTSSRIAAAINKRFPGAATSQNSGVVSIETPAVYASRGAEFLAELEGMTAVADRVVKIVINERTGTIVLGREVRISPVSILHGSLSVEITTTFDVSQPPAAFSGPGARTEVVPNVGVGVKEEKAKTISLKNGATVEELVRGLQSIGSTARDIIAILQNLRAAGALEAELEVI